MIPSNPPTVQPTPISSDASLSWAFCGFQRRDLFPSNPSCPNYAVRVLLLSLTLYFLIELPVECSQCQEINSQLAHQSALTPLAVLSDSVDWGQRRDSLRP